MTWRSFRSFCRKNAKRVPYHPEAFLQDAPAKPPQPVFYRVAALAGTAAVLVVAFAAVLLSNLFQPAPGPGFADSSASYAAFPAGVDPVELYTYLAELSYTDKVQPFEAEKMTAAEQLQYANQVYLREHGASLLQTEILASSLLSAGPSYEESMGTGVLSLPTAQALLNRLFGPNAKQLSKEETIGSFLSWQDGLFTTIVPSRPRDGEDVLMVSYSRTAIPQDSSLTQSSLLTAPLFYYVETVQSTEDSVTVKTAAFAPSDADAWEVPVDLTSYNRLQSQLRNWRQTHEPNKTALYTFGLENGVPYLLSCRDAAPAMTTDTSSAGGTTEPPSVWSPSGWTGPGDPPPVNEPVRWLGKTDPNTFMPLLKATALLSAYSTPFTADEKQHAARGLIPFIEVPYIEPEWNIQAVPAADRVALFEKLGIPEGLVVYAMPFDSLNQLAGRYFETLQYTREDLYPAFRSDADDTQLVLDAESDTVYVVIGATGARNNVFVVADEQQRETVVQYTILYMDDAQDDAYIPYYAAYGYAAVQRYFLKTYRFWENSQVLHMDVDYQSGQPRLLSFQYSEMPFGKQKVLAEWAWNFIQVDSADSSKSRQIGDIHVLEEMTRQLRRFSGFFAAEDGSVPAVRYQDIMACVTEKTILELEKRGYLENVGGEGIVHPWIHLYTNEWGGGRVLIAETTDIDDIFNVVYTVSDFRLARNRTFSVTMERRDDGVYYLASLPQEIP